MQKCKEKEMDDINESNNNFKVIALQPLGHIVTRGKLGNP